MIPSCHLGNAICTAVFADGGSAQVWWSPDALLYGLLGRIHIWTPKCIAWANVTRSKPV